jgi:hypothetical protein
MKKRSTLKLGPFHLALTAEAMFRSGKTKRRRSKAGAGLGGPGAMRSRAKLSLL